MAWRQGVNQSKMGAQNKFAGKYHEGLFANGQGPVKGQEVDRESESTGVLNPPTSGRNLKTEGGSKDYVLSGSPSDKNFDLHSSSYAGPENNKPKDMGEASNQPGGK